LQRSTCHHLRATYDKTPMRTHQPRFPIVYLFLPADPAMATCDNFGPAPSGPAPLREITLSSYFAHLFHDRLGSMMSPQVLGPSCGGLHRRAPCGPVSIHIWLASASGQVIFWHGSVIDAGCWFARVDGDMDQIADNSLSLPGQCGLAAHQSFFEFWRGRALALGPLVHGPWSHAVFDTVEIDAVRYTSILSYVRGRIS